MAQPAKRPLLTLEERQAAVEVVVAQTVKRVPVLVQVGAVTTAETLALADHARSCGADGIAALTPYYYALNETDLTDYFCQIANHVPGMCVYLYNIPQRTGNVIPPAVTEAVSRRCPNVVGEKDSSGDLVAVASKVLIDHRPLELFIGTDALVLPGLAAGVRGAVAGHANLTPEWFVALYDAYQKGDWDAAQTYQNRIHKLTQVTRGDLSVLKRALSQYGFGTGAVRPPLAVAEENTVTETIRYVQMLRTPDTPIKEISTT